MPETKEKQTKEKQTQTTITSYNNSTTTVVQERHLDGGVLFGLQFYHRGAKFFTNSGTGKTGYCPTLPYFSVFLITKNLVHYFFHPKTENALFFRFSITKNF